MLISFIIPVEEKMQKYTLEWIGKTFDADETNMADRMLAMAGVIVEEMRAAIYEETGFRCSAGIAHNKVWNCEFSVYCNHDFFCDLSIIIIM